MLSLTRPLGRLHYFALGFGLFILKCALDFAVASHFGRPYSLFFYVSPMASPLFRPDEASDYWVALWGVALPFIGLGCVLTLRRLLDAALSPWLVFLFFVPFANLVFFAVCVLVPAREGARTQPLPAQGAYRGSQVGTRIEATRRGYGTSIFLAGALGAVIGLGAIGISVGLMRSYGAALMLGAPVISGFATSMFFGRMRPDQGFAGAALATIVSFILTFGVTVTFALEGLGCLAIVVPLVVPVTFFGSYVGYAISRQIASTTPGMTSVPFVLLPLLFGAERLSPLPEPPSSPVESEVIVDAPPEIVWQRVIAFPPLPPPDEFMFRHGIAAPLRATIDGEGPGAVRRCEFTTGTFVEPIEIWSPGRELTFSVTAQPDPMREETLWESVRPPHLDGYLKTTRGQFALEPLPGGKTRLVGRTWYKTGMTPEPYFRLWGDAIIHRIHLRVLNHVRALAEADMQAH